MTNNRKRKIKRQAHKDFRKQCIRAYRLMAESMDSLQTILISNTSGKNYKFVHYKSSARINKLYKKMREFAETASRPYDGFYTDE